MLKAIKVLFDSMEVTYEEISKNEIAVPTVALSIPKDMSELLPMKRYSDDLPLFADELFIHIKQNGDTLDWMIVIPECEDE